MPATIKSYKVGRVTVCGTSMQYMIILQGVAVASKDTAAQLRTSTTPSDSLQQGVRRLVGHQPRSQLHAGPRRHYRLDALTWKVSVHHGRHL